MNVLNMKLHEVRVFDDQSVEVMRVPAGWIYRFFQFNQDYINGMWVRNDTVDSVFVPFNAEVWTA